jgi:hypothetical protein
MAGAVRPRDGGRGGTLLYDDGVKAWVSSHVFPLRGKRQISVLLKKIPVGIAVVVSRPERGKRLINLTDLDNS